jgi:hypothetical protein
VHGPADEEKAETGTFGTSKGDPFTEYRILHLPWYSTAVIAEQDRNKASLDRGVDMNVPGPSMLDGIVDQVIEHRIDALVSDNNGISFYVDLQIILIVQATYDL